MYGLHAGSIYLIDSSGISGQQYYRKWKIHIHFVVVPIDLILFDF